MTEVGALGDAQGIALRWGLPELDGRQSVDAARSTPYLCAISCRLAYVFAVISANTLNWTPIAPFRTRHAAQ